MADSLGEYRFLLLTRRKETFSMKLRHFWLTLSTGRRMALLFMIMTFLGIIIAVINLIDTKQRDNSSQLLYLKVNDVTVTRMEFRNPHDRKDFLEEWRKESPAILRMKTLLIELHERTSLDKSNNIIEATKKESEADIKSMCALVLEELKRILNKCLDIEILPWECRKVILKSINCSPSSRYRTINGSCNNLYHKDWGMYGAYNRRWLDAVFYDNVSMMRKSVLGNDLPNPRFLTSTLYSHKTLPDSNITMLFTYFGLFLDHDLIRSGQMKGSLSDCCKPGFHRPPCVFMEVPPSDYFYGPLNVSCLGLLRNKPTVGSCPGKREQMSLMTAFMDGSDVYGPTDEESDFLRAFKDGKLRSSTVNGSVLLPIRENAGNVCYTSHTTHKCFDSGDVRTNMLLPLMTLHTVWAREHNRLASELQILNPAWDDETLFQEARRILIAELQCITYREFLPNIFGHDRMKELGLYIDETEVYDGYNKSEDPTIRSAFLTSVFRFGHSMVQKNIHLVDSDYKIQEILPVHETYLNPGVLYDGKLDSIIRGLSTQSAQQVEPFITEEVRGRLLQRYYMKSGLDLSAVSILRGRDYGIPPYLKWRKFCNLSVPKTWEELKNFMREEYVESLKNAYQSIEDIDLIPGGLGENHEKDSLIGPTYSCLMSKQFYSLRTGDRFWFENPDQPGSFTKDQLREIYKSSFAAFLCNTSDKLSKIQKFPFLRTSEENPITRCEDLPQMDLSYWKE